MRERIYKLMINEPPADDKMMEKYFTDNMRKIKRKWYKEQHRQIQIKIEQGSGKRR